MKVIVQIDTSVKEYLSLIEHHMNDSGHSELHLPDISKVEIEN